MSKLEVDAIEPQSGTTLTLGANGDSVNIASGATITDFTSTGIDDNATSTAITIDSNENVLIGTTSSPSGSNNLLTTGFIKGAAVSQTSGFENATYTLTTPGTVYVLNKDQGAGGGSSATTFNITGIPDTDGSSALIYVRASNTVGGVNCTAIVQLHGNQLFTGGVQNATKTSVFWVFKANSVWQAGAQATGAAIGAFL